MNNILQAILQEHAAVFKEELRETKVKIETVPHFHRPHPVPFVIKAKVEEWPQHKEFKASAIAEKDYLPVFKDRES